MAGCGVLEVGLRKDGDGDQQGRWLGAAVAATGRAHDERDTVDCCGVCIEVGWVRMVQAAQLGGLWAAALCDVDLVMVVVGGVDWSVILCIVWCLEKRGREEGWVG